MGKRRNRVRVGPRPCGYGWPLQVAHKDFSVSYLAGLRGADTRLQYTLQLVVCDANPRFTFEIDGVLCSTIELVWPFRRPKPFTSVTVMLTPAN